MAADTKSTGNEVRGKEVGHGKEVGKGSMRRIRSSTMDRISTLSTDDVFLEEHEDNIADDDDKLDSQKLLGDEDDN